LHTRRARRVKALVMRALLVLPLFAACVGVHGGAPEPAGAPVSLVAAWSIHASGQALLCNAGETVTVTVGGIATNVPCAGLQPYPDGALNRTTLANVPTGMQTWNVLLHDVSGGVNAELGDHPIEIADGETQLPEIDLQPAPSGTTGGIAIVWDIVSADHMQYCSGALREALEVDIGASTYLVHAADWKASSEIDVPISPAVGIEPFATIVSGVPAGATATVRLVNTQDNSTEAQTTVTPMIVGGRTVIQPTIDFIHCP
jgi:hypothetical protein